MEPSNNDIRKAIEQSGYLFEQRVSRIVDASGLCGHFSDTNASYTDDETGKSREVDIMAGYRKGFQSHLEYSPGSKLFDELQVFFLFECKCNYKPIVFFSRDRILNGPLPILTGVPEQVVKFQDSIPFVWYIESKGVKFKNKDQWLSSQYAQLKEVKDHEKKKAFSWELVHEDYHESILGLIKACSFYSDEHGKTITSEHISQGRIQLCLIYPIIVLGGTLIECKVAKETFEFEEVQYMLYRRQHYSSKIQNEFNIHVTTINNLPNFLINLNEEITAISGVIQNYIIEKRKNNYAQQAVSRDAGWFRRLTGSKFRK